MRIVNEWNKKKKNIKAFWRITIDVRLRLTCLVNLAIVELWQIHWASPWIPMQSHSCSSITLTLSLNNIWTNVAQKLNKKVHLLVMCVMYRVYGMPWHGVTEKITRMDKITISIIIWNAMHFSHLSRASYTHISVGDMKGDPNRD